MVIIEVKGDIAPSASERNRMTVRKNSDESSQIMTSPSCSKHFTT